MKKLLAIFLAFILVLGLTACGESSNAYWTDFEVDETTYKMGVEKDSGITILEGDVEYIFYFYKVIEIVLPQICASGFLQFLSKIKSFSIVPNS